MLPPAVASLSRGLLGRGLARGGLVPPGHDLRGGRGAHGQGLGRLGRGGHIVGDRCGIAAVEQVRSRGYLDAVVRHGGDGLRREIGHGGLHVGDGAARRRDQEQVHEHVGDVALVGVVAGDVVHLFGGLVGGEVVLYGSGYMVGGGAVGVLGALVHHGVVGEVPADLGPGLIGEEHAQLRLGLIGLDLAGKAQGFHGGFLVGVLHPHQEAALLGAAFDHAEQIGHADVAQVAEHAVERAGCGSGEELVGHGDWHGVVGVVDEHAGGVVAVHVDACGVKAAGEAEEVLQEDGVDHNNAIERAALLLAPKHAGKVRHAGEVGVDAGVGDAAGNAVAVQGDLLGGHAACRRGGVLAGDIGAGLELSQFKFALIEGERAHRAGQAAGGAQLGVVLRHEEVVARAVASEHAGQQRGDLIDLGDHIGRAIDGAGDLCGELLELADVRLGQLLDALGSGGYGGFNVFERLYERVEHVDVDGAVLHEVGQLEVCQAGTGGDQPVLHERVDVGDETAHV